MIIDEDRLLAHLDELEKSTKKKHGKKKSKNQLSGADQHETCFLALNIVGGMN